MRSLQALWKRVLSFSKSQWQLEDYPIEIRFQRHDPNHTAVPKYLARIVNWWTLNGFGETEDDARQDLRRAFDEYAANNMLPRPGAKVPIKLASADRILNHADLAIDFFPAILRLEFQDCFVSDESCLMDFGGEWSNYCARVLLRYKVDISDLEPGNFISVFERIQGRRASA